MIVEAPGEGTDTAILELGSGTSYVLADDVENGQIATNNSVLARMDGNQGNNAIIGNDYSQELHGLGGDDIIRGGGSDDALYGEAGNDTLDGGTGTDTMAGGAGNDIYYVDSYYDAVTENANEGIDTVQSSFSYGYTLGDNVENLTLTGTGSTGTGNELDNVLIGNVLTTLLVGLDGNDTLNAGGGAATLIGGKGDDTYIVDNTSVVITENINEGNDTVLSSLTYSLASFSNVENLTLTGTSAIDGTGNALNNVLIGNNGVNTLAGNLGDDTYGRSEQVCRRIDLTH